MLIFVFHFLVSTELLINFPNFDLFLSCIPVISSSVEVFVPTDISVSVPGCGDIRVLFSLRGLIVKLEQLTFS